MFTSGFSEPQILDFQRSLSLSWDPKAVLFRLAKFLLEALLPGYYLMFVITHLSQTIIY
jgi:hypothetical protein